MTTVFGVGVLLLLLLGVVGLWMCHTVLVILVSCLHMLIDIQQKALTEHQKPLKLTQVSHGAHGPVKGPDL